MVCVCPNCKKIGSNVGNILVDFYKNPFKKENLDLIDEIKYYPGWSNDFLNKLKFLKGQILLRNLKKIDTDKNIKIDNYVSHEDIKNLILDLIKISNNRNGIFDSLNLGYCFGCGTFYPNIKKQMNKGLLSSNNNLSNKKFLKDFKIKPEHERTKQDMSDFIEVALKKGWLKYNPYSDSQFNGGENM